MKRVLTGVVAVALITMGGVTPAFAEAPEPDVLEQILDDTAPARLEGDDVVARTDDVTAVLPADDPAGQEAAMVAPPWALDADGRSIPTHYEIDGGRLTQVVDTADTADVTYPVVADPGVSVTYTQYRITSLRRTYNWTNRGVQIGLCKIERGAGGGQCTISASREVETTIQTSLGASVNDVAVGINFSASNKRTVSVSWTSPRASVGSSFKAWATGTKATYQVQKWIGNKVAGEYRPRWRLADTSGQLTAFTPTDGFAVGQ